MVGASRGSASRLAQHKLLRKRAFACDIYCSAERQRKQSDETTLKSPSTRKRVAELLTVICYCSRPQIISLVVEACYAARLSGRARMQEDPIDWDRWVGRMRCEGQV